MEIRDRVRRLLDESLCLGGVEITGAAKIWAVDGEEPGFQGQCLNADSLDFVEIVMACEEEFEIEIDDDDAERKDLRTVDGLVAYIEERKAT